MKGKRQIVTTEYTYDCIEYVYVDLRVLTVKDYIFMIHQYLFKKKGMYLHKWLPMYVISD